jgi:hypothetical protein
MVFSWMTGLMLLGAIPPGLLWDPLCPAGAEWMAAVGLHPPRRQRPDGGGHGVDRPLGGPFLTTWTGSAVLGGHLGMLGGMLVGMEAGMFLGEATLGLQPWREWRWGADPLAENLNP